MPKIEVVVDFVSIRGPGSTTVVDDVMAVDGDAVICVDIVDALVSFVLVVFALVDFVSVLFVLVDVVTAVGHVEDNMSSADF